MRNIFNNYMNLLRCLCRRCESLSREILCCVVHLRDATNCKNISCLFACFFMSNYAKHLKELFKFLFLKSAAMFVLKI